MKETIDYIMSLIFGGMTFTMLINFQVGVRDTACTQMLSSVVQADCASATATLEYDFQKIGYGCADSVKILQADSTGISFKCDIDADGSVDNLRYYLGGAVPGSSNPNALMLYRQVNTQQPLAIAGGVSRFRVDYFNGAGNVTGVLSQVRSLRVSLVVESNEGVDDTFPAVCWERMIKPRNLR
jgi:hypothetical protein